MSPRNARKISCRTRCGGEPTGELREGDVLFGDVLLVRLGRRGQRGDRQGGLTARALAVLPGVFVFHAENGLAGAAGHGDGHPLPLLSATLQPHGGASSPTAAAHSLAGCRGRGFARQYKAGCKGTPKAVTRNAHPGKPEAVEPPTLESEKLSETEVQVHRAKENKSARVAAFSVAVENSVSGASQSLRPGHPSRVW